MYKFLNVCLFDYTAVAGSGKVVPINRLTSWVVVVTPTDRPKSVRNRCVIELFLWRRLCCDFALLTFLLVQGVCHLSLYSIYKILYSDIHPCMCRYSTVLKRCYNI